MKACFALSIFVLAGILSCKPGNKSTPESPAADYQKVEPQKGESAKEISFDQIEDQYIHTKYEYEDSSGRQLLIQNSFPKGGLKYTDSVGKDFTYAIFWSQIINRTNSPLDLSIDFSVDSLQLTNSPDIYHRLFLPSETMTADKASLFNYGLKNLKFSLDSNFDKPSSLHKTIPSKGSHLFYVIALTSQGVDGTVRAGFSLEKQTVLFRINGKEIKCGRIEFHSHH